jgi:hypothetical protein
MFPGWVERLLRRMGVTVLVGVLSGVGFDGLTSSIRVSGNSSLTVSANPFDVRT